MFLTKTSRLILRENFALSCLRKSTSFIERPRGGGAPSLRSLYHVKEAPNKGTASFGSPEEAGAASVKAKRDATKAFAEELHILQENRSSRGPPLVFACGYQTVASNDASAAVVKCSECPLRAPRLWRAMSMSRGSYRGRVLRRLHMLQCVLPYTVVVRRWYVTNVCGGAVHRGENRLSRPRPTAYRTAGTVLIEESFSMGASVITVVAGVHAVINDTETETALFRRPSRLGGPIQPSRSLRLLELHHNHTLNSQRCCREEPHLRRQSMLANVAGLADNFYCTSSVTGPAFQVAGTGLEPLTPLISSITALRTAADREVRLVAISAVSLDRTSSSAPFCLNARRLLPEETYPFQLFALVAWNICLVGENPTCSIPAR